ncbi:MAG TPA: S8 family serine peptidase [Vicinamibacteria bacterium]
MTPVPPQVPTLPRACPICRREPGPRPLLLAQALPPEVRALAAANTPWWSPEQELCGDCAQRFAAAHEYLRHQAPGFEPGAILPTPLRLGAPDEYRGRGVTIAFLDSGFYAHPDLVEPEDRIVRYVDVTNPRARRSDLRTGDASSWHGMMTSVVACGNGRLSGGLYRGIASEARVVLVKCGTMRRIRHDDIRRGLDWVVRHREQYGIRVVNVSCGGDYEASYLHDRLSQAAERATREGMLVVAAVGNLGQAPGHPVLPPASAPSALTVGGLDDRNRLAFGGYGMYHSSFGPTVDGLQKPEVIAPGIWVAAPILPGTPTAAQAELLARLDGVADDELRAAIADSPGVDSELDTALGADPALLRQLVAIKLERNNLISGAYKHVDGTSFASPIVASLAAQMLEANPGLSPGEIKRLLVATARPIADVDSARQGSGVVDAAAAVRAAEDARHQT